MRVLHLTTHLNTGGITSYILKLVKPLAAKKVQTFVASSGGEFEDSVKARGAAVLQFPIRTKSELNPKIYFQIPKVIQFIRENKIDLIHAHTRVTQVMAFWIQVFHQIPVVTTCHGFYKRRLGRRINPAWGNRTIAISRAVGNHLSRDHKVDGEKIHIIHNSIHIY